VFHGPGLQTETIDFYRRATVLVFPSVWQEPFGIPIVEAMACGLPVVSTCSGGIPEIVEHGQTGMLVARGDAEQLALAISQVIDDPVRARDGRSRSTTGARAVHLGGVGATPCRSDRERVTGAWQPERRELLEGRAAGKRPAGAHTSWG
jgi:glycosyltransferase involved in cell wall biosynthesis